MRLPALRLPVALATLTFALLSLFPTRASASTYIANDAGRYFYGMDNSGDVVFTYNNAAFGGPCSPTVGVCYETFKIPGYGGAYSDLPPSLAWDDARGTCVSPVASPCSISDNGWTATISYSGLTEDLYGSLGGGNPVLLATGSFGTIFAINGVGDVVYDDGTQDRWAATFIPAPEPSSLLLLGTAMLGLTGAVLRRRQPLTDN